ncbi:proline-rich protein 2-like [Ovis canadensis]|uniref:proline-rich protein 2-like n=1 Tax=Ovis canadensis TaxID=37174 RepID=UPI003750FDF2
MRLGPEQGSAERGDGLEPQGESGAQSPSRGRGAEGRRPGQGRPTPRGPGPAAAGGPGPDTERGLPPPPLLGTPSLEVTLPSHPRTPHFRFRRGQRPRHSPAASPASPPPPPPPPGSAVRPLRGSARPPHARRPPRDARARPATLAFQPARGRCPQGRVARPPCAPIGSWRRGRALRLARGAFLSFMRLTPPRPPPRALPFTVRPPPPTPP